MAEPLHRPVLCSEVVRIFGPQPGKVYVDATVGLGGHTQALLEAENELTIVAIDRDEEALKIAAERLSPFGKRVHLIHGNYSDIREHLAHLGIEKIAGFLLDLGLSSLQLDSAARGFSFRWDGPLDMRMDTSQGLTAADLVNKASEKELSHILRDYGEERFAQRIARAILASRMKSPIDTTQALAEVVRGAIPKRFHPKRIDPATRTFQALRIAVNQELLNLKEGLEAGFQALETGGVMAAISFHSLEDRIIKQFFRYKALSCTCPPDFPVCVCDKQVEAEILTRKPIRPSSEEITKNPRARSAKLRAALKVI
ncbi:TPA: 16S rRNA (cytosine(1402)-N(4))-methyltransferase [Candidatus Acetothermia bacterium]|nr:16S rRNA (cytosine(1402)-N(4))-methyltransferase [Candidatus Acetothermia bacterium]